MKKPFVIVFFLIVSVTKLMSQSTQCNTNYPLVDSIGKPFLKEAFFLREIGMKQNDKDIGLPYDRLLQYPFFIPYIDTVNLFENYENGFFVYIDAFSAMKDSFNNRGISFKEGSALNQKFSLIESVDTIGQGVKFAKRDNYRQVKSLFFEYELYKLKFSVVYIGKYCRKVPHGLIERGKSMFIDKPLDVYVVLDIVQYW